MCVCVSGSKYVFSDLYDSLNVFPTSWIQDTVQGFLHMQDLQVMAFMGNQVDNGRLKGARRRSLWV